MTREDLNQYKFWLRLQKGQAAELALERIAKAHGYAVEYNGQQYQKAVRATESARPARQLPDFILYKCANWNTVTGHDNEFIAPPATGKRKYWYDCEHWSRCWNFSGSLASSKHPPGRKACGHFCYTQGGKIASGISVEVKCYLTPVEIKRFKDKIENYYQSGKCSADRVVFFTTEGHWCYHRQKKQWYPLGDPGTGLGFEQPRFEQILQTLQNFLLQLGAGEQQRHAAAAAAKLKKAKKPRKQPKAQAAS